MSLSDYLKYLRAVKGGLTPWEIADATGVPASTVHLFEVKHRLMGEDEATLSKLADFYGVPVEELARRRGAYRKRLTNFLEDRKKDVQPLTVQLENGEVLSGALAWYSREALAIQPTGEDTPYVIQRCWVADWRAESGAEWEVAGRS